MELYMRLEEVRSELLTIQNETDDTISELQANLKKSQELNREMSAVIEFYGNPDNYDTCNGDKSRIVTKDMEENPFEERLGFPFDCGGKRARQFLAKNKEAINGNN